MMIFSQVVNQLVYIDLISHININVSPLSLSLGYLIRITMRLVLLFHILVIICGMVLYVTPMNLPSNYQNVFDPMAPLSMVAHGGERLSRRKRDFQRAFNKF